MDLSGLIFVALAVAWAAYLIPKALRHHDDVARGRSIDRFSHSLRVLARREPVSARKARLVAAGEHAVPGSRPEEQHALRRAAAHRATRRRRRVLAVLLLGLAGMIAAAAFGRVGWTYVAVPAGLLVCWLVACRLMVRRERAWRPADVEPPVEAMAPAEASPAQALPTEDATPGSPAPGPGLWDPVPVTLPTYVSKPPARRSVRTIDLDATGVWTSGRTASDSALAREADAADAAERVRRRTPRKESGDGEAVGS